MHIWSSLDKKTTNAIENFNEAKQNSNWVKLNDALIVTDLASYDTIKNQFRI